MYILYSSNFALIYLTTKYMALLCCALNSVSVASTFGSAIWRITMNKSRRQCCIYSREGRNQMFIFITRTYFISSGAFLMIETVTFVFHYESRHYFNLAVGTHLL